MRLVLNIVDKVCIHWFSDASLKTYLALDVLCLVLVVIIFHAKLQLFYEGFLGVFV